MKEVELTPELRRSLEQDSGYIELKVIPGRGICGVSPFIFTVAVVYGIDEYSYEGRWCYATKAEALSGLREWDGVGDPSGEWIKYKGRGGERSRIPGPFDE